MICTKQIVIFPLIFLGLFLFWCDSIADYACASEELTNTRELKLDFGTPILLRFISKITSEQAKAGQMIDLEVEAPVYKDGVVVIAEGTPAKGNIIACNTKGYAGEGGNLVVANFYVVLENSQMIRLDGIYRLEGKDKPESVAIGQCCFFGYLIKGEEALVKEGQTFRAVLARDVIIK